MTTLQGTKIDMDWGKDGKRRFIYQPKMDGDLSEGDSVKVGLRGLGEVILTIEDFGEEFGDGARYAYGKVDFSPAIERFAAQLPGELTEEMEEMARQNLPGQLTDSEIDTIIDGLR